MGLTTDQMLSSSDEYRSPKGGHRFMPLQLRLHPLHHLGAVHDRYLRRPYHTREIFNEFEEQEVAFRSPHSCSACAFYHHLNFAALGDDRPARDKERGHVFFSADGRWWTPRRRVLRPEVVRVLM